MKTKLYAHSAIRIEPSISNPSYPFLGLLVGLMLLGVGLPAHAWITAVYTLNGGTASLTNQTYNATNSNQSAVWALNSGNLTLVNPTITTSGNTTNSDDSSFYGLNAGVLATTNSAITIRGGSITTTGTGANGVFANGSASSISLTGVTINCSGQLGHGVDATWGGTITVTNCTIATQKANGSVLATDRGGGYINVWGGTYSAAGQDSAGVYSTGTITVNNATVYSTGGEAIVVEGANSAMLTNCTLSGVKGTRDRGVFIYQSMSGDATGFLGSVTIVGGSYTWPSTSGPAFYFTNTKGTVFVRNVSLTNRSPILLQSSTNQWGNFPSNGGTAAFTAEGVALTGAVLSDNYSTNFLTIRSNTTLTGYINKAALTLDATSAWVVTSNSVLTCLTNSGTMSGSYPVTNLSTVRLLGGVISTILTGTNGLIKTATNTALLSGASTYSGPTIVSNGALVVGTCFAGKGNFIVTNGATLGFTNQFTSASAAISNLTIGANTSLEFLNVSNPATALITGSNVLLLGTSIIKIVGSNYLAGGSSYPLVTYAGTFTGSFTNLQLQMPSGLTGILASNNHQIVLSVAATLPATPTALTATAGDAQVILTWQAATNATGYNLKRSVTDGAAYTSIATNLTSLVYTNTGLHNGTNYYYVVSATNGSGESADSAQASARPVSMAPPQLGFIVTDGWLQFDWPATHLGWKLQGQTNNTPNTGLGTNWSTVAGSDATTQLNIPIGVTNGSVFFRLVSP